MPYLVNFSREFYEKLGHEVVDELVEWLNQLYDQKSETALLRRAVNEVLQEVRELRLQSIVQQSSQAAPGAEDTPYV